MILLFILVSSLVTVVSSTCNAPRQGCFEHKQRMEHILYSDRQEHSKEKFAGSKEGIDWANMKSYLEKAVCRCEKAAAAKGYNYFSLRNFGECHGIKTLAGAKSSLFCFHHDDEMCQEHHERCTGAHSGEFIYKVTIQQAVDPKAACKGMVGRYFHSINLKMTDDNKIYGNIGSRPTFRGAVEKATTKKCFGQVNFPDDRTYKFEYDIENCMIYWDYETTRTHWWKSNTCDPIDDKADNCEDLQAHYFTNTPLNVNKDREITGHIQKRPGFKGKVTLVTSSECRGYVNFPDDRTYIFDYDRNTCTIHWDWRRGGNKWKKRECLHCEGISGWYFHTTSLRMAHDGSISGQIAKRPKFSGKVQKVNGKECKGYVNFPDDRRYSFDFDQNTCTIYWDSRTSGNTWRNAKCGHINNAKDACKDLAGKYWHNVILDVNNNRKIKGRIGQRPEYSGFVTLATASECRGWVNFPDDRTYLFEYDRRACTIHWDHKRGSNKWRKACPRG